MKAHLIEVGLNHKHSVSFKKIEQQHFKSPFHFHELCEMNYVIESFGKRIVGDNISNFSSGDFVLMNSNLPHIWYNDPLYFKESNLAPAKAIVTYFDPNFLIELTNDNRFTLKIAALLEKAKRGVRFFGNTQQKAVKKLDEILNKNPLERVADFLEIINIFLESDEYECLASIGYQHSFNQKDTQRMNNVYQYIIKNFSEPISLQQIASVANLTPPAFCNFFKKRTQKSFTEFLNELRVGHACKLLENQELTIADVCFQSGYQNMTHFNNFFKKITKKTPSQYRKEYISL
ncbi:MAG: AraC family transcriptional regulator [Ginsengibacter sp.]